MIQGLNSLNSGGSTAAWSPASLAASRAFQHVASLAAVSLVSGGVDQWADTAAVHNAQAPDAGSRPVYNPVGLNGYPAIEFSGGNKALQKSAGHPTGSHTHIFVHSALAVESVGSVIFSSLDGNGHALWTNYTSRWRVFADFVESLGSSLAPVQPNRPEVLIQTYDAPTGTYEIWQNGVRTGRSTGVIKPVPANWRYGQYGGGGNPYVGNIAWAETHNRVLTPSEIYNFTDYLMRQYGLTRPIILLSEGDSLSTEDFVPRNQAWSSQLNAGIQRGQALTGYINALSSSFIDQTGNNISNRGAALDAVPMAPWVRRRLIVWCGTNDVSQSGNPAAALTALTTYVQTRKNTGLYDDIFCVTAIPRWDATITGNLLTYSSSMVTAGLPGGSLANAGCTGVVNLNTLPEFNADGDYNNTTFYNGDKIHLTAAGLALVANRIKSVIGL
jgi:lysophospholipase L1-like esterase